MASIAIFEDEPIIQYLWEDLTRGLGFEIAGVAQTVRDGETLAKHGNMDLAILDIAFGDDETGSVLDILEQRRIPVLVCSGLTGDEVPEVFQRHERLEKPFSALTAGRVIRDMLERNRVQ